MAFFPLPRRVNTFRVMIQILAKIISREKNSRRVKSFSRMIPLKSLTGEGKKKKKKSGFSRDT